MSAINDSRPEIQQEKGTKGDGEIGESGLAESEVSTQSLSADASDGRSDEEDEKKNPRSRK